MEVVVGSPAIDDVDAFLGIVREIEDRTDSVIQAIDSRYVAGDRHVTTAVELATRARDRGEAIADDPALEILLYVAGTRQIEQALRLGISAETTDVVIVIHGGDESAAAERVQKALVENDGEFDPDPRAIEDWYEITTAEREATTASLETLVCERVALLTVDR